VNEMIERVAKAMMAEYYDKMPYTSESWDGLARAAIAVMREPTDAMLDAGEDSTYEPSSDRPYIGHFALKFAWYTMIDKALEDESPS
jgi:hypothetical protein